MFNFNRLCDQMAETFDCLEAARSDGAGERTRDLGNQVKGMMQVVTDSVKCTEDVDAHFTSLGLVDLEFNTILPDAEQALVAEAKSLYGAAYAGAQTINSSLIGDLDDVVMQEKKLRDTLKARVPVWASKVITNAVTGSSYTLADVQRIREVLRDTNRISNA